MLLIITVLQTTVTLGEKIIIIQLTLPLMVLDSSFHTYVLSVIAYICIVVVVCYQLATKFKSPLSQRENEGE